MNKEELPPAIENNDINSDDDSIISLEEHHTFPSTIYSFQPGHFHNKQSIPFEPEWAIGIEIYTCVVNLTTEKLKCRIFYAASHIGIIYDDTTRDMKFLVGHKNKITCTCSCYSGKYLVTGDSDAEHSIVIWDSEHGTPVFTIFEPHPVKGTEQICMSGDAKHIVSIGREIDPKLKFWIWTLGNQKEDDCITLKQSYGELRDIVFNPNESKHFMVTFTECIIFFTWGSNGLERWVPENKNIRSKGFGNFQTSVYIENTYNCITATTTGWVIIWGSSYFDIPFNSIPISNNKILIKKIRLQKTHITCLVAIDGLIVTGDMKGHIKFYDKTLKILYWYKNFAPDSIVSITFNLNKKKLQTEDIHGHAVKKILLRSFGNNDDDDRSDDYEKIYAGLLPSDYSLLKAAFFVRDFIVVTNTGVISYVDFPANQIYPSFSTPYAEICSLAVHDAKPIICIGYSNGHVVQFNYEQNRLTFQETIMNSKEERYNEITSIAYSTHGLYLACSTSGGHLWFLEPSILKPMKKPFIYNHSKIFTIQFSTDNNYIAYYDSCMAVCLLKRSDKAQGFPDWIFHGRYIAHYKAITDLLFCCPSRLFSISEDRCLVEYDVKNSEPGKLVLVTRTVVMQTGTPICFMCYYLTCKKNKLLFLISSSEYKYYIVNETGNSLEKTILAPTLGDPVKGLKTIPALDNLRENHMIFCNNKMLGIQLLPITGNPFKRVSMIAHPTKLVAFKITNCGKYVFTFGEKDSVCIKWRIKFDSVEYMHVRGGTELNPYYCLIEGGVSGWLFNEMKDLFYYMQILHDGEDSPLPRKTYEKIATCELPNLIRSIGFFPSEYQLDNILYEVKHYYATVNDVGEEEISFENFVKLYINHRPVGKYHLNEIYRAFSNFATNGIISRNNFIELLTNKGERFDNASLQHCLSILTSINKEEDEIRKSDFSIIPHDVTYEKFTNDILGINMTDES